MQMIKSQASAVSNQSTLLLQYKCQKNAAKQDKKRTHQHPSFQVPFSSKTAGNCMNCMVAKQGFKNAQEEIDC